MKKFLLLVCLTVNAKVFAQLPSYVPANGLVAFWTFNNNTNDASGNGNNGTVNGTGVTPTTDRLASGNSAYSFSDCASNIHANVNTASINSGNGAMTVAFWAYRSGDGCSDPYILEFSDCAGTCTGQLAFEWPNSQNISLNLLSIGGTFYFLNTNANNTWYHIVYTYDGITTKHYLNGVFDDSDYPNPPYQLNGNVTFGSANPLSNGILNGKLDDIGIWNRALSACEVNELYTGNPSATFAYNPLPDKTTICDSVQLDAGSGYASYIWNTGEKTQTISANTAGWHKVTVTNSGGCTASDSTFINIIKPTIVATKQTICKGENVTLSTTGVPTTKQTLIDQFDLNTNAANNHAVSTTIGATYIMQVSGTWSYHFCPGQNNETNNPADAAYYFLRTPIQQLDANTDLVKWNGSPIFPDNNSYNSNHTYNYTLPIATQSIQNFSFSDPGTYVDNCGMLSFLIYQIQASGVTYHWSTGETTPTINVSPKQTTTYYVTVSNGITSCMDSVTITLAHADTSLNLLDPPVACKGGGSNVRMQAANNSSYKWLFNNAPVSGASAQNYTATQSGDYNVIVTNNAGCVDTSRTIAVALFAQPVPDFTINDNIQCLTGNSFSFTNTTIISNGFITNNWDFGDNQIDPSSISPVHSYTNANNYTVKLIASSEHGCKDSISKTVTVIAASAAPIIHANGPLTFCENGSVVLTSSIASGNQWYDGGIIIAGATQQNYTATTAGTYAVAVLANNCPGNQGAGIIVSVIPTPVTPIISPAGSVAICGNGTALLTSNASVGNQWYKDGALISQATNANYQADAAGTYTVVSSVNNCSSNSSAATIVTISSAPQPPVITAQGPVSFCASGSVELSSGNASGNQWYGNGVALTQATDNIYTASAAGIYTATITDNNGCTSIPSNAIVVSIPAQPKPIRYPSQNVLFNSPVTLNARTFGDEYLWTPATGLNDAASSSPIFNYDQSTDYVIKITTDAGCVTYDSLLINAYFIKGIILPTAFSPNNDGLNDHLHILLIDVKELKYFRIFNKWGQIVFETTDASSVWDGFSKGTAQPIGNYIWIGQAIDNDGKTINQHGQIVLVR